MKRLLLLGIAVVAAAGCGGGDDGFFNGDTDQNIRELRRDIDDLQNLTNDLQDEVVQANPDESDLRFFADDLEELANQLQRSSEEVINDAEDCSGGSSQDREDLRFQVDDLQQVADDLKTEVDRVDPDEAYVRQIVNYLDDLVFDLDQTAENVIDDAEGCR